MAATYSCDGCGCNVVKPAKVGHVIVRDYCDECAGKAQAFLEAEELLRSNAHAQYISARQALIATAGDFKLPDVPNE